MYNHYVLYKGSSWTLIETLISQNAFPQLISNWNAKITKDFIWILWVEDLQNAMFPLQGDEIVLLCSRMKNQTCNTNLDINKITSRFELFCDTFQFKGLFLLVAMASIHRMVNYFKNTLSLLWSIFREGRGSHSNPHLKIWAFNQTPSTPSLSRGTIFVYLLSVICFTQNSGINSSAN